MSETIPTVPPPDAEEREIGSYFIANYPPFSVWTEAAVARDALAALGRPGSSVPLGLYLHIPFCRKRCHFCYFRVYTDRNARDVAQYLEILAREWEMYLRSPALAGRRIAFVYFGGGTPSFLSARQIDRLAGRLRAAVAWSDAEEVTFECEPGTLTRPKLDAIRAIGVTRLSLGIEHFDDEVLALNGRAHRSREIFEAYDAARRLGFPQINVDLIAGMLGDSDARWQTAVDETLALEPDSVTIYQMELPYNTTISADLLKGTGRFPARVAPWATRRRWVREAFQALEAAGYRIASAYTAVRDPEHTRFVYRDRLWQGADLVGLGVASFGHLSGVHMQNLDTWDAYCGAVAAGRFPLHRAYRPSGEERLIRELVLQLKLGSIRPAYFAEKYGVHILDRFGRELEALQAEGWLADANPERVTLTREGLLRVDALVRRFFLPQHRGIRYT